MESFEDEKGMFVLRKITPVPNNKTEIEFYTAEHDEAHDDLDSWMNQIPNERLAKECAKWDIDRANKCDYRRVKNKRATKWQLSKLQKH